MLALAVALGCDIFDSAAYALYAREGKYMTEYGTVRLRNMSYFPCSCGVCSRYTPAEVLEMEPWERTRLLAWHNLSSCFTEIRRIKQAIRAGRLWELLEVRCRSHPSLFQALKSLRRYEDFVEVGSLVSKERGLFYYDSVGLARPEVVHYRRMLGGWIPPGVYDVLLLLPQSTSKPFHGSKEYRRVMKLLEGALNEHLERVHVCAYAAPFGVIPTELDEVYPLSQFEVALPFDRETVEYVGGQVEAYLLSQKGRYGSVVLHYDVDELGRRVVAACEKGCRTVGARFLPSLVEEKTWGKAAIENLVKVVSGEMKAED
jgi:7-cyano-7-deazaguanine tRNA-ribosyltransferase